MAANLETKEGKWKEHVLWKQEYWSFFKIHRVNGSEYADSFSPESKNDNKDVWNLAKAA